MINRHKVLAVITTFFVKYGRRVLETVLTLFFVTAFTFIGYCAWLMLYPYKVMEPISFMVDSPTVYAGDDATFTFVYSKYMQVPARVIKRLENHVNTPYQDNYTNMKVGEHLIDRNTLRIPSYVDAGQYRIVMEFIYQVNPLRTITIRVVSDSFNVIRRDDKITELETRIKDRVDRMLEIQARHYRMSVDNNRLLNAEKDRAVKKTDPPGWNSNSGRQN
jgi:hypothetical protein